MSKNVCIIISFITGTVIGALATHRIAEQKYSNIADEEIQSVIDRFSNRERNNDIEELDDTEEGTSNDEKIAEERVVSPKNKIIDYRDTIDRFGYDQISKADSKPNNDKKEVIVEVKKPKIVNENIYVIAPDDFDTLDGFTTETLYYSSDNYVLDSDYNILSDSEIERTIGRDPYANFGEFEDDSVYVRNEDLMCDYEILLSMKTSDEIRG